MKFRTLAASVVMAASLIAATALQASATTKAGSASPNVPSCTSVDLPVAIVPGGPVSERVYGQICNPLSGPSTVLQVLVHGVAYDHTYWDLPGFNGRYSYVKEMTNAGYSTLAIDRVGSGRSSHPNSALITSLSDADVIHQVVEAARAGHVGSRFDKIVLVGHSYGTLTSEMAMARYGGVDGLIGTGWLDLPDPLQSTELFARAYPAGIDPKFPELATDPGYLTTRPGERRYFYEPDNADPAVMAKDEELKQTVTATELATFAVGRITDATRKIEVPVQLVVGEHDVFFCQAGLRPCGSPGRLQKQQEQFFAPDARLEVHVQPNAGHDVSLEKNNGDGYRASKAWLARHFPVA